MKASTNEVRSFLVNYKDDDLGEMMKTHILEGERQMSLMTQQPEVSVIVPVYNGEQYIGRCLDALQASSTAPLEIIVVNDSSQDNTAVLARQKGAMVLQTSQQSGPACTRNLGVQHAKGDILLFIDADVLVKENTIKQVADSFLRNPEMAAMFGSYDDEPEEQNFISQYRNLFHHFHQQQSGKVASTFWGGGAGLYVKRFLMKWKVLITNGI